MEAQQNMVITHSTHTQQSDRPKNLSSPVRPRWADGRTKMTHITWHTHIRETDGRTLHTDRQTTKPVRSGPAQMGGRTDEHDTHKKTHTHTRTYAYQRDRRTDMTHRQTDRPQHQCPVRSGPGGRTDGQTVHIRIAHECFLNHNASSIGPIRPWVDG